MAALTFLAALGALQAADRPAGPDSAQIRNDMVAAQRAFEFTRRRHLPVSTAGTGRCDVRVGRFCYWYDPTEPAPPAEPERIRQERARFLARLAEAAALLPGDEWILGQRVRYLVEHGLIDSALAVVSGCAGWWCRALEGFALHVRGDVAGAEGAFDAALAAMPERVRCEWNDMETALEAEDREPYERLGCAERDSANTVLFFGATPLFSRAGNDVRTEWYARHTLIHALQGAVTHHGSPLGPDLREVLLRYGWATAYGRRPDTYGTMDAEVDVVGHEPKPAYPFLAHDQEGRWPPGPDRPRARFAPVFAGLIAPLENVQVAAFRRGDGVELVAGASAGRDTLFQASGITMQLALTRDPAAVPVRADGPAREGWGRVRLAAPYLWGMVSVEVHDSAARAWAVHREPLVIPELISGLLLTVPGDSLPASLHAAARTAWAGRRVPEGGTVGLFWESYGHPASDTTMKVTLTIEPMRAGFFGRVGQSLGLRRRVTPLRLAWARPAVGPDIATHAVEIDLSQLGRGAYEVTVEMPGRRATAPLEIVRANDLAAREPGQVRPH